MLKNILSKILLVALFSVSGHLFAQEVANIDAEQIDDQKVLVTYDLLGELPGQVFTIYLFSSANNFELPLLYVSGDVGDDIPAGNDKSIEWDISQELVSFDGDLTFEVRAVLTFSPLKVTYPVEASVRRGKAYEITWLGTDPGKFVDIELFRDDKKISTIGRTQNDGSYQWNVPIHIKQGQGYAVKISSTSSTQFHQGGYFAINRKIPLLVKFIPLAVAAPVVLIISDSGGSSGPRILPAPPDNPD